MGCKLVVHVRIIIKTLPHGGEPEPDHEATVVARELKDWVKTDVVLLANMPTTSRNSSSLMLARNKSQKTVQLYKTKKIR